MSDPEVPQNDQPKDIDEVVGSANEGLDAAAAARADVPGDASDADAVDPDLAAFEAAERDHPGVFPDAEQNTVASDAERSEPVSPDAAGDDSGYDLSYIRAVEDDTVVHDVDSRAADDATAVHETTHPTHETTHSVADDAYAASGGSTETQVMPAEPIAPPVAPQPIFVQAPEPPRELGNRGTAGVIGLVATIAFAILYLGAILGLGALAGDVTGENIGTQALAPLMTWAFWVPVVVFFLAFWLLGAFINRGRWGKWVILGLLVAAATYGGHLLGQLFQAPFWRITASESSELVDEQLLAPLAIAAFVFARELTIWFGAWVARAGARKKALNAEAQAEYERTLEAGPSALR
ncbi:MAG TPA: ABC transporter [Microbacterium sp.]|nr:ABC transporter [Microbacterium sp.]